MLRLVYKVLLCAAAMMLFLVPVAHAQKSTSDDTASDLLVKWDTQCIPRGCLLMTDVLRGYSEDPPDEKDDREYISIMVAIDRTTRKAAYFAFHVDPRARKDDGIFVTFTKTVPDGKSWKMFLDKKALTRIPIDSCDNDSCISRIGEGILCDDNGKPKTDLLARFMDSSSLIVLYTRNGHPYRTMILLSSFKKAYQHLLDNELAVSKPKSP